MNIIDKCIEVSGNYPDSLKVGSTEFDIVEFPGGQLDYYMEPMYIAEKFPIARLKRNGSTWMSITPMEIESHLTHVDEAEGHVLVGGLGMGYYITQIVKKPEVKRVTVIEYDREVITAYNKLIESNPVFFSNDKLEIIHGDLFETIPKLTGKYDYAYLDIWLDMCSDKVSEDMQKIAELGGINAEKVGFWGMEKFVVECWDEEDFIDEFGELMRWCIEPSYCLKGELL